MDPRALIMVVDDQLDNRLILEDLLSEHYRVHIAENGRQALDYLRSGGQADLILLDVVMPEMDGFEACRQIKSSPVWRDIPVIILTSLESATDEAQALLLGAADFVHKPVSPPVVLARVGHHLKLNWATQQLRLRNEDLERAVAERTEEVIRQSAELAHRNQALIAAQGATIMGFCSLAETRDNETGNHIRRTQSYVRAVAEALRGHPRFRGLDDEVIALIYKSAPLHDIGKVGIPDAILQKPGKLDAAEWAVMQRHCQYGRDAIVTAEAELGDAANSFLRYAREIAYGHHERWDGSGYPQGLAGEAIPMSARLMAVADVYDALVSVRVYKTAFSHERAMELIATERGKHFDPDVADAAIRIAPVLQEIAQRFADPPATDTDRFATPSRE